MGRECSENKQPGNQGPGRGQGGLQPEVWKQSPALLSRLAGSENSHLDSEAAVPPQPAPMSVRARSLVLALGEHWGGGGVDHPEGPSLITGDSFLAVTRKSHGPRRPQGRGTAHFAGEEGRRAQRAGHDEAVGCWSLQGGSFPPAPGRQLGQRNVDL